MRLVMPARRRSSASSHHNNGSVEHLEIRRGFRCVCKKSVHQSQRCWPIATAAMMQCERTAARMTVRVCPPRVSEEIEADRHKYAGPDYPFPHHEPPPDAQRAASKGNRTPSLAGSAEGKPRSRRSSRSSQVSSGPQIGCEQDEGAAYLSYVELHVCKPGSPAGEMQRALEQTAPLKTRVTVKEHNEFGRWVGCPALCTPTLWEEPAMLHMLLHALLFVVLSAAVLRSKLDNAALVKGQMKGCVTRGSV